MHRLGSRETPLRCVEVSEAADLEAVYRLRFDVYVREMGRRHFHADVLRGRLEEPLDRTALHLAAYADAPTRGEGCQAGGLVGALRLHLGDRAAFEAVESLYGLPSEALSPKTALVQRLVTRRNVRGGQGSAGLVLAKAAYWRALQDGVEAAYVDCAASLLPFFEWMGFDLVRRFTHAEFGEIAVLWIDPMDRARLARSDSPFLPLLDRFSDGGVVTPTLASPESLAG